MEPFSKQLKDARKLAGLTQEQCAELFEISARTLIKIESGQSEFTEIEKRGALSLLKSCKPEN